MIASSAAHSLLGWKELRGALERSGAPPDLILDLGLGWHFGGAAMLTFGGIVVALFTQRLRGTHVSMMPAIVVGATYVLFGAAALVVSRFNPFFLVFLVPGLMLLIASVSSRVSREETMRRL